MSYTSFDFPHTHFYDDDLRELIKKVFDMSVEVKNFVSVNTIKYANPIQWNITSQYEKNTIVIDPQTGTAYISVAAVPSGVALTREEFWTVVFDLGSFVTRAAKNFTTRYEQETTLTATFNSVAGDWLVWGDTLYIANVNITAGDAYVVDGNIRRITVEEVKNTIMQLIADNYDAIIAMIGDLNDLTTTAKNNLVAAINEVVSGLSDEVQARQDADSALSDRIDDEVQARQDADGNLNDLTTTDKTNVVAAINEVDGNCDTITQRINKLQIINVKDYGAIGDGVNDDTQAIQNAVTDANTKGGIVYFPYGTYLINNTITITKSHVSLLGENRGTKLIKGSNYGDTVVIHNDNTQIEGNSIYNLTFDYNSVAVDGTHITYDRCDQGQIENCLLNGGENGILILGSTDIKIDHCALIGFHDNGSDTGIKITNSAYTAQIASYIEITNTRIFGPLNKGFDIGLAIYGGEFINVHDSYLGQGYYQDILIRDLDNVILEVTIDSCYIDGVSNNGGVVILDGDDNSKYIGNVKIVNSNIKGQDGSGTNGVAIGGSTNRGGAYPFAVCGFIMEGCTVSGWGQNGVVIQSGNSITIANNHIDSNNVQNNTLPTGEVVIYENVKKVCIDNNLLGRIDGHNGTTDASYAVYYVGSNAYTNEIIVKDNIISGVPNTTNGLSDYSATKSIYDNNYYGQASELRVPTFPTSDAVVVNPYGCDAFVAIYGTNVSAVTVNGTNLGRPSSVILRANDSIAITYTGSGQGWYWLI